MKKFWILALGMMLISGTLGYADVVVSTPTATTTTTSTWRTVDTPVGTFFHLIGDIVALPFHALGWLF